MLKAENLTLTIAGAALVSGIDHCFVAGRVTVIVGPNGAGKSSLLKCLAGLIAPTRGSASLDGVVLPKLPVREKARRIGYLPQQAALHWNISVRELVRLGRYAHGDMDGETGNHAVEAAMRDMDLSDLADRPAQSLSGGERARAMLARVLAGEPEWILADEPLAALDIAHRIELLDHLLAVSAKGVGVVLVDHDLALLSRSVDDVLLLDSGRLVAAGPADQVLVPELLQPVFGAGFAFASTADGNKVLVNDPLKDRQGLANSR